LSNKIIYNKILTLCIYIFCFDIEAQGIKINEPISYLALGDSYTIGQSVDEKERWPNILIDSLQLRGYRVNNFLIRAKTGWTTGNLINSLDTDPISVQPNLVSLLIGVNNQYQSRSIKEYEQEFEILLKRTLNYVNNDTSAVFVLSIPDYAYTPFGAGSINISIGIDDFNSINRSITEKFSITYIDITDISRLGLVRPELVALDGLHPSGIQYAEWVYRILQYISSDNLNVEEDKSVNIDIKVFPNPFNINTTLSINLKRDDKVNIRIYNIYGELIKYLKDDYLNNGLHQIVWNGKDDFGKIVSSGIYIFHIETSNIHLTKKILLVK
jgi:lysophospholipase L1-like esterase